MDMKAWKRGDECPDDGISHCSRCRPAGADEPVLVYVTARGSAYHRRADCKWLHRGQRSADQQGMETTEIQSVTVPTAEGRGKVPCESCFPSKRGGSSS